MGVCFCLIIWWVVHCFLQDTSPFQYSLTSKPKSVPNCLVSHLTYIHFKGYRGCWREMDFASYVLHYGLVLKTMHISGFLSDESKKSTKYHTLRKFSNMPRGSTVCQLKFEWVSTLTLFILLCFLNKKKWCLVRTISFTFSYIHVTTFSTMLILVELQCIPFNVSNISMI